MLRGLAVFAVIVYVATTEPYHDGSTVCGVGSTIARACAQVPGDRSWFMIGVHYSDAEVRRVHDFYVQHWPHVVAFTRDDRDSDDAVIQAFEVDVIQAFEVDP